MTTVALVDDERLFCQGFCRTIDWEREGFTIVGAAHTGPAGYELCCRKRPDIVVTDIRMPGFDGLELTRRLREVLPDTQVIILSAFSEFEYARQAMRAGAAEYLLKAEIEYEDILEAMKRLRPVRVPKGEEQRPPAGCLPLEWEALWRGGESRDNSFVIVLLCPLAGEETPPGVLSAVEGYCRQNRMTLHHLQREGGLYCLMHAGGVQPVEALISRLMERLNAGGERYAGCCRPVTGTVQELAQAVACARFSADWARFYGLRGVCLYYRKLAARRRAPGALLPPESFLESVRIGEWEEVRRQLETLCQEAGRSKSVAPGDLRAYGAWCLDTLGAALQAQPGEGTAPALPKLEACSDYAAFARMFQELGDERLEQIASAAAYNETIRRLLAYVRENLHRPISLSDAAGFIHTTPAYLSAMFRGKMNMGFNRYVTTEKLRLAKQQLLRTDRLVGEIADSLGFHNESYFTRVFKKFEGVTPEAYRLKNRARPAGTEE